jgi:PAS domain S-box-containing protein
MIIAAPEKKEADRLVTLRNYSVLDTPAEKDFDDLVALAAHICGAPIALISLVDENRQWFKAAFGLGVKETARDVSFCAHAIHQPAVFIVPDAMLDRRFADNPLVKSNPGIRFYAGSPLIAPDGQALGTLCVIDRQPRQLTKDQAQALSVLSRHVMAQLELRRQAREMTRANGALLGILEDTRLAETALRESEAKFRNIIAASPVPCALNDEQHRITFLNREFVRTFGYDLTDIPTLSDWWPKAYPDPVYRQWVQSTWLSRIEMAERAYTPFEPMELKIHCKDGATRIVVASAGRLGESFAKTHLVTLYDITERKLAEERVHQLNRVYAVLSDINQTIVRERDPQKMLAAACLIAVEKGQFPMAWIGMLENQKMVPVSSAGATGGYLDHINIDLTDETRAQGPAATAFITGGHAVCNDIEHDPLMEPWRSAALQRGYRSKASFALKVGDQSVGTLNLYSGERDFFDGDELRLLSELAADISFALEIHEHESRRQRVEQDLRASEERFRQVVENIQEVFWITDPAKNQMLYISPAYEAVWGRTCASLYASPHSWLDAIHPDDHQRVARAAEARQGGEFNETYRIVRPNGAVRWIRDRAFPIRNAAGVIQRIVGVAEDITARKTAEDLAHRSQRLESIGTLAGGVAHDLNNALAPIIMGIEILKMKYPRETQTLDMFHACARRGADMVRQLLSFAKGVDGEKITLQPARIVRDMDNMMKGSFPKNIQLVVRSDSQLPTILGDATQLDQVVLNLCVNARDAMPNGGTLTLEAQRADIDATFASSIPDARPGRYVMLRVRDTGTGIPPEIIDRIFDPFFTTKAPDKGTGLGLSTVLGIVKGHGGFLQVDSQLGQGATFCVYLPVHDADGDTGHVIEAPTVFRGEQELILFVDDEAAVREIACAVLQRLNFKVVTATDGLDGLVKLADHRSELRAIITDLHMPHMDGLMFVRSLRRVLPDIPVTMASGRLDDATAAEFKALGMTSRLDKPFSEQQLAEALKNLLARK